MKSLIWKKYRRNLCTLCRITAVSMLVGLSGCSSQNDRLPNIVLIFADDQGYADLGNFGAKGFTTPNIDNMAREGMRFTNFYVSQAVCSASRAALLTGAYSERVSIRGALMPWASIGLNPEEETIAELLKKKGYATAAFGKWHLGHLKEFLPQQQGFDEYLGIPYSNDMWPVNFDGTPAIKSRKKSYPPLPLIDGDETSTIIKNLDDQATLTTRYTERAVQFIEKNKDKPFFLYMPHSMPHVPLGVSDKFKGKSEQGMYGDVIMEMDWSVGEVLRTLKENGLDDNTLVIYTSDNGPWMNFGNHAGSALPLREGKGTMWEGGARVPAVMRWPGRIPAGKTSDKIASTIDILPTLAAITGADLPKRKIDGVNILPLLEGDEDANPRDHFFYYYGGELQAVRQGRWKLHFPHSYRSYKGVEPGNDGFPGPYASGKTGFELYDLQEDIGEKVDMAGQEPLVVERLKALAQTIREQLGDRLTEVEGTEVREPGRRFGHKVRDVKHQAIGKKVTLSTTFSSTYKGGGSAGLVDGKRGSTDHQDGRWQGYEGRDFEAIIDLGTRTPVKRIRAGFLRSQGSWIFFPASVEVAVSSDGRSFKTVKSFTEDLKDVSVEKLKTYVAKGLDVSARYVRVKAKNVGVCPEWHVGAGGKAWVFVDEIMVN